MSCVSNQGVNLFFFFCNIPVISSQGRLNILRSGDPLGTPHPSAIPALSYTQTSCLPSMFPFILGRCDGIPCSVSCCERPSLGYGRGGACGAQGAFAEGREARFFSQAAALSNELPEAHSALLSLSCWSRPRRPHMPRVVYINGEWS